MPSCLMINIMWATRWLDSYWGSLAAHVNIRKRIWMTAKMNQLTSERSALMRMCICRAGQTKCITAKYIKSTVQSSSCVWQRCRVRHLFFGQLWLGMEHHVRVSIIAPGWGFSQPKLVYTSPAEIRLLLSRRERWIFNNRGMILTL